jgi:hypothetical protein
MNRLVPVATLVACLSLGGTAWAAGAPSLPLAAPPVGANPASTEIFEAMQSIARAAVSNPGGAQAASVPYASAIQQYNAGKFDDAQRSAMEAIVRTGAPTYPQPTNPPPNVSPGPAALMPDVATVPGAEMEERVGLARRALASCGPTTGATYLAAYPVYQNAVTEAIAQHLFATNRDVQYVIDTCASVPAQSSPSATSTR